MSTVVKLTLARLAANYSRELADYVSSLSTRSHSQSRLLTRYFLQIIYVIDVSGGAQASFALRQARALEMLTDFSLLAGDKIPRKGGPGISQSDLLVVNKVRPARTQAASPRRKLLTPLPLSLSSPRSQIDIAQYVGASLEVMKRDADKMRDHGPTLFTSVKNNDGVEGVAELIKAAWTAATGMSK